MVTGRLAGFGLLVVVLQYTGVMAAVLTPPYFNLATGRRIMASATCGEDISDESELYCKLAGANADSDVSINLIQGQVCDYCGNLNNSKKSHPATNAVDGSERWWQSPPLSRGMKYNEVNLTIDLGQEFHVAYVTLTMANSPRPGVWVLERSSDNGVTYKPWQYFADSPGDCENYFGRDVSLGPITRDDTVLCDTRYSKVVPLEGGEIFVSLLKNRPSAGNFFDSDVLQEWTRATNIRLRLLRTKTLLGHLMSVARQDPTVTRRYFYSIKDISIGGRCRCNGHADTCDIADPRDKYKLLCRCQHNTCGTQCEQCCPGFVQKAWRISTEREPFRCEACNCYGHSNECFYDEEVDRNRASTDVEGRQIGGGVCTNCQHNTIGINCNECIGGFYRPYGKPLNATDVCQPCRCQNAFSTGNCEEGSGRCECRPQFQEPNCDSCSAGYYDFPTCKKCDCNINGTRGEVCHVGGGQCPCKFNFAGRNCEECSEGFYNFPECLPCECNEQGSVSKICDPVTGSCECSNSFGSRQCNQCENGYFGFPNCKYCNCDVRGTETEICDKEGGKCLCLEGYGGPRCDQCVSSYFGYPECRQCNCSVKGSQTTVCDATGKCPCLDNFSGKACDQCRAGYYKYPECLPCTCNTDGTMGVACDDAGKCQCKPNFDGIRCETCKEGYYNFPLCEDCLCDPSGVVEYFSGCKDAPAGELCQCKPRVQGRICNECKPLYWNLQHYNPLGCQDCNCFGPGILGNVRDCEGKTGQCYCKPHVVSQRCQECEDGYFNLQALNLMGCSDCGCTVGGSVNNVCDKTTGACQCRPRITGKTCTEPLKTHYFPTLYQFQHEAEDGATRSGGQVRFAYDESHFPNYSWRGYAVYNDLQPETYYDIYVDKSSLYRLVLNYQNPSNQTITGEITAVPDSTNDVEQKFKVRFEPGGGLVTVSTLNVPSPLVLNPGRWRFTIKINQYMMLDYFTLLPAAYYEGSILQKRVNEPCLLNVSAETETVNLTPNPCVKLEYPSLGGYDSVQGVSSYVKDGDQNRRPTAFYTDTKVLDALDLEASELVALSPEQKELWFDFKQAKNGRYALVIDYFTPAGDKETEINVESTSEKGKQRGKASTLHCIHATLCRLVVTNEMGEVAVFPFSQDSTIVQLSADPAEGSTVAVQSVTAIPSRKWVLDFIRPKEHCIFRDGACITTSYDLPPDSIKVEAEVGSPDRIVEEAKMPRGVTDKKLVRLDNTNRTIDIPGRVLTPGYHRLLVHYYQPENPDFTVEVVVQNGQHYEARVPIVHCPSTAGCRSLIAQDDGNSRFFIDDDFILTLKSPKNVSIDYIVAVPAPFETDNELSKFLAQKPLDETRRFIEECGQNHMHLPTTTEGFCRDAVFSLTTDYNNGAVPCECSFGGSKSFECEEFGGQCPCKDNVIGRRCERCKTGFFGYPNCKPCSCPSTALCDPSTGACICPPRVVGEKCDTCAPFTYGFHALIGCEECGCKPLGVQNRNLQCDLGSGKCTCKENIVGQTCDKCVAGYWAYPYCQLCNCDIRGATMEVCNQETSDCYCKSQVEGRNCETCKVGSFNLEESNPNGCTKCFCFGKTSRCSSSPLFWTQITIPKSNWSAAAIDPNHLDSSEVIGYEVEFEEAVDSSDEDFVTVYIPEGPSPLVGNETNVVYFRGVLNGNFLASYGGVLSYIAESDPDETSERETFTGPDVILEGSELPPSTKTIRLFHYGIDHLDGDHKLKKSLLITETDFVVESPNGGLVAATRDQLMILLKGLKSVYIRAAYWKQTRESRLSEFGITIGSEEYSPDERALSVERCQCPPNYQGLSCEECAPGYYRTLTGPFGGFCVPCQCNGHSSDSCDPVSGICTDCRHNTAGDHCELCEKGYHGDATGGTPNDCLICACPLPFASNNFADSCEFSNNGRDIYCQCREEYYGPRCESCAPGYFGNPEQLGSFCRPCECSGNIDVNDPGSCDTRTGACLKCMNNTGGAACNLCAPGFYGDALITKQCVPCECNECGIQDCNPGTGQCNCLPNVEGIRCERCAADHYGLSACDRRGCHYCACSIASESTQCDDSGQCPCKKGTTGQRCERCAPGYWNYTEDGCQSCSCNSEYAIGVGCNPATGQCQCLPGVIGEKCDRCPYRWVLLEDRGCQECDSCQFQLLDDTDRMAFILDPIKKEFDDVAKSYFTTQRRTYFNDTAAALEPDVALLNPSKEDLNPYYESLAALELDSKTQKQKAEITNESLKDKAKSSLKLHEKSIEVESKVQEAVAKARTAVFETKDLMEGLLKEEKQSSPQTEAALSEARTIIDNLNKVKFMPDDIQVENVLAGQVLRNTTEYLKPITNFAKEQQKQADEITNIRNKLKDIRNESDYSVLNSDLANEISGKIRDTRFPTKIARLEGIISDMQQNLGNASELNEKTTETNNDLAKSTQDLDKVASSVKELVGPLEQTTETLKNELKNNRDTIRVSNEHVRNLKREADRLDGTFEGSRGASERAVNAATAYQKITEALNDAYNEAETANRNAQNATARTNGIGESAARAQEPSRDLLILAEQSVKAVENDLKRPLEDSKRAIAEIQDVTKETAKSLASIDDDLSKVNKGGDSMDLERSITDSMRADEIAQSSVEGVQNILSKLPTQETEAKKLPIAVTDLNKRVEFSEEQLNEANESIPESSQIIERLEQKKPAFDETKDKLGAELADLRARIQSARELANRVPVGINFQDSSTLVVGNPASLDTQQVQSKISVFFKTHDPRGLVLFLGNEPGKKPENDFMAIEIEDGYAVLTVDLGSGPQRYTIPDKYVSDDRWYKASVERSGRTIQFAITEEQDGKEIPYIKTDSYSKGGKSLFNVDRNSTKIFVGGFPPGDVFKSPVKYSSFRGSVEDLRIGEEKVGLWNFRDAQNIAPALGRDSLVDLNPKRGLRFLGNGYAVLDRKEFPFVYRSAISFKFQTTSKTGLLFLVGKGKKFLSLEIVNGFVAFKYNLGSGVANLTTPEPYNDGRWHTLSAVRDGKNGIMEIDKALRARGFSPGESTNLGVSDYVYFGGYPGQHEFAEVTNKDFEGCIDDVLIDDLSVDLTKAIDTRDSMVGCPASQVDLVATFYGEGYLKVDAAAAPTDGPVVSHAKDDIFELNFRFRSNESNGLIFYGADKDQENYLSVSMANGILHIRTNPGETKVQTDTLNDGDWHVVTVTRDKAKLMVNVDDAYEYQDTAPNGPLSLSTQGSLLLFGGKPQDYDIKTDATESESPYNGCLGDISINGKRIDFTDSENQGSAVTQKCQTGEKPESLADFSRTYGIPTSDDDGEEEEKSPDTSEKSPLTDEHEHVHPPEPVTTAAPPTTTTETPTTTTTLAPRTKKPEKPTPPPYEQCALPYRTEIPLEDDLSLDDGIRFGNFEKTSRLEFQEPMDDGLRSDYSIDFKTENPNGVILMKTNVDSSDFIAVYIKGGSIHFAFDSGAGIGLINTTTMYDDGKWHSISVVRNSAYGELSIDNERIGDGLSAGTTTSVNAGTTLYVGGLSNEVWAKAKYNTGRKLGQVDTPFQGCLRNLLIRRKNPGPAFRQVSVEPCTEPTENGYAFYPNSGYMRISEKFHVGKRLKIELSIRPRKPSGILLAVHGDDYLILQMVNGTIKFTVDNGRGPVSSTFSTGNLYDLCDGRWHTIQVSKAKNLVTLAVDRQYAALGSGETGVEMTRTNHPLYLGGHPNPGEVRGFETHEQFVGCMKDLNIEGPRAKQNLLKFNHESIVGGAVGIHTCPAN